MTNSVLLCVQTLCLKPFPPKETTPNLMQKQPPLPIVFSLIQVRIVSTFPRNYFSSSLGVSFVFNPTCQKMVVEYLEMEILSFWILKKEEIFFFQF